jgi:SAM-dependent methyltransferase
MNHQPGEPQTWNQHWRALEGRLQLFGRIASLVRRQVLARAVRYFTDRYFPRRGLLIEAGCGTSESSWRMQRLERTLVGIDFSLAALCATRQLGRFDGVVCADIRHLPFADGAVSGIWNLGVMEHFAPAAAAGILDEFRRVCREQAIILLFWLPSFGLSRWVLGPLEWFKSRGGRAAFRFFPDEVNRLSSRRAARQAMAASGLELLRAAFTFRDGFNHLILVARKPTR